MSLTQTAWTPAPASLQSAFGLTPEQDELRTSVRRLLEKHASTAQVRALMSTDLGHDQSLWKAMAETGLPGLIVPEEFGGYGFNHVDLAVVLEEMGRAVACAPLLATQLAVNALMAIGDGEASAEYLPGLASGALIGTLAMAEGHGEWDSEQVAVRADGAGTRFRLTGAKTYVLDGGLAHMIIVTARDGGGGSIDEGGSIRHGPDHSRPAGQA